MTARLCFSMCVCSLHLAHAIGQNVRHKENRGMQKKIIAIVLPVLAMLAGCAGPQQGATPDMGQSASAQPANYSPPPPPRPYSVARHKDAEPADSAALRHLIEQALQRPTTTSEIARPTEYLVLVAPQGQPLEITLLSSSGDANWDRAVSEAIRKVPSFSAGRSGKPPANLLVFATPSRITASPVSVQPGTGRNAGRPSYADRVAAAVRPNVRYADVDAIQGNPAVELNVTLSPDGKVIEPYIVRSSGIEDWDVAAIVALLRTGFLPRDIDGRVPPRLVLVMRPKY